MLGGADQRGRVTVCLAELKARAEAEQECGPIKAVAAVGCPAIGIPLS